MNQQPAAESDATEPQAEGRAKYTVIPPAGGEPGQGKVVFVGAGPGAADLITVRGARTIASADIIIWASSLVNAEIVADRPDRRARDLDNLIKPILDALKPTTQAKGVIEDDHLSQSISIRWTGDEPVKAACVRVILTEATQ